MHPNSINTQRPQFLLLLFCALSFLTISGCSQFQSKPQETERENLIGRPPAPEQDDPFFARALPAEAVPAEPSGHIGAPQPEPTPTPPEPTPPKPAVAIPESPEPGPQKRACFSCIQICPLDDKGRPNCQDTTDDLICGWGSHTDIDQARQTARAHCDATLDMARQLPTYSEISGACPIATCQ